MSVKKGLLATPEYAAWAAMKYRCNTPTSSLYHNYGARGIRVCDRWNDSFSAFYEDMGQRPTPNHSLDRIDNDGDYSPENCRWASWSEQQRNRSITLRVEWKGEVRPLIDLAEEHGINLGTCKARLRNGWSLDDALNRPKGYRGPR